MQVRSLSVASAVALSGFLVAGTAAPALAACDSYSGSCPTTPPTGRGDIDTITNGDARTLPFTGGELALMTAVGVGALAGGTALVVAGRRKRTADA